jgi:aromatic-L-amino-acid/L-tryptophan decarboxylase
LRRETATETKNDTQAADLTPYEEGSEASASLDPADWRALRAQAHRMLDDMLDATEMLGRQPVWQPIPDPVRQSFHQELPRGATPLASVHEEFMTSILPFTARNSHPGFMGWVQGGGTPVGMLAEMLAAGLNANCGGRDQIPLEVERQVTEWMCALFGFPDCATGLFASGTSMASFIAIAVARNARLGRDVRRQGVRQHAESLTAYASAAVHGSISRALDMVGLGSDVLRLIPVDRRQRMDLDALAASIAADRAAGLKPFLVVGSAGTVDTGAVDDLAGIAEISARERLWFHVDGAFGALAMLVPELAPRLKGIERADSLAFDFHKWAQVPYDAGFILVRDGELHKQAFASSSAYLERHERGIAAGSTWPCDLGPELSRSFRALKTWFTLKVYGTDAIGSVIRNSCRLARSLASRIAETPELQLMATVELNIVCFRYSFKVDGRAASDELLNQLNRQLAIALQEAGAVAPSTTMIGSRLAIRAAIVNHRTTHGEINALVDGVLQEGRALEQAVQSVERPRPAELRARAWGARLHQLDALVQSETAIEKKTEVALRFERATLLARMGQKLEARDEYLKVLVLEPTHRQNLIDLGRLLVDLRRLKAAQLVYSEAVKHYPDNIVCRVNLGAVLLEREDHAGALVQYEAALGIDPELPQAHGGMYYALAHLGEPDRASYHQRIAFGQQNLIPSPYRGTSEPIPVLLLVSSTGGNTPIEKLLDDRVFQTYVVVTDFFDTKTPLPDHHLVVNGIGDVDVSEAALAAAEKLLAMTSVPVLNLPAAVRATGRCENARRLQGVPGLIVPRTRTFRHQQLTGPDGADALLESGFIFPLLLRAPGFHMGQHFLRVDSPAELAAAVNELPGNEVLAIEYLDAHGADGRVRKYRVMMVDQELYPLHLAISNQWKIHYFSADMADCNEHRQEDAGFLNDMSGVLGPQAMATLEHLKQALGLDYAGVDFGLDQQGNVLLFEANATMIVQEPDEGEKWDYRRPAVASIHAAVHRMFIKHSGAVCA